MLLVNSVDENQSLARGLSGQIGQGCGAGVDVGELGRVVADSARHFRDGTTARGSDESKDSGGVSIFE